MGPFGALVLCFFVFPSNKKSPPSWSCPKWKDVNVIFFLNNSFTSCGWLKMLIRSKNSMYILMDMFKNIRHFSAWLWTFQFLVIFFIIYSVFQQVELWNFAKLSLKNKFTTWKRNKLFSICRSYNFFESMKNKKR